MTADMKSKTYKIKLSDLDYYTQMRRIPSFIRSFWASSSEQKFQRGKLLYQKQQFKLHLVKKKSATLQMSKQVDVEARKRDASRNWQKLANERALVALRKKQRERTLYILRQKNADQERG